MSTIELMAPRQAASRQKANVAAIAAAMVALVLVCTAGVALVTNAMRDGSGYLNWPTETFAAGGYAIATNAVDVSDAPKWVFGDAGLNAVRVKADSDRPLFIGIARADDVERYLHGVANDEVSYLDYRPFRVNYTSTAGGAPARRPSSERFWVKSVTGAGSLALAWKPKPGDWRAVVMNADGSRGITAALRVGVRTTLLRWVGIGLLVAGVLCAALAARLYAARSKARALTTVDAD
jgi:hypothetical protein